MRRKKERLIDDADLVEKDIKRQTRRRFSAEVKIRIVLSGLRGKDGIEELCRQLGIAHSQNFLPLIAKTASSIFHLSFSLGRSLPMPSAKCWPKRLIQRRTVSLLTIHRIQQ